MYTPHPIQQEREESFQQPLQRKWGQRECAPPISEHPVTL